MGVGVWNFSVGRYCWEKIGVCYKGVFCAGVCGAMMVDRCDNGVEV